MDQQAPNQGSRDDLGDPILQQVAAASLRLLAGSVPRRSMNGLQGQVCAAPGDYPWQEVTAAILADPLEPQGLLRAGLRAQRDWILRGGRETPRPRMKARARGLLAASIAGFLFMFLYTAVVVVLLLTLRHNWDWFDIYWLLERVYALFPGLRPGS